MIKQWAAWKLLNRIWNTSCVDISLLLEFGNMKYYGSPVERLWAFASSMQKVHESPSLPMAVRINTNKSFVECFSGFSLVNVKKITYRTLLPD